jgi:hypothetical protein
MAVLATLSLFTCKTPPLLDAPTCCPPLFPLLSAPHTCANPQELLGRETLVATLARVLREDGRRSLELATSLTGAFWALSVLAPLHRALLEQQVGGWGLWVRGLHLGERGRMEGVGRVCKGVPFTACSNLHGCCPLRPTLLPTSLHSFTLPPLQPPSPNHTHPHRWAPQC